MALSISPAQTLSFLASSGDGGTHTGGGVVNWSVSGLANAQQPDTVTGTALASGSATPISLPVGPFVVTDIDFLNTAAYPVAVSIFITTGSATEIGPPLVLPANGGAHYGGGQWTITDGTGVPLTAGPVAEVINTDGTILTSPITGAVTVNRPAITGDISVPAGSNTATVQGLAGIAITGSPAANKTPVASDASHVAWTTVVTSFNSRPGAVNPTAGDYTAALVTNAADKASASTQAFTADLSATAMTVTGAAGATLAARFCGRINAIGPPTDSGLWLLGDVVEMNGGSLWACIQGSSPGPAKWLNVGFGPATYNTPTFTSNAYTLQLTDAQSELFITPNGATAQTVNIPTAASAGWVVGNFINFTQVGTAKLILSPNAGVTMNSAGGLTGARAQYSSVSLLCIASDSWVLTGDIG